jgi:hypothetical protein
VDDLSGAAQALPLFTGAGMAIYAFLFLFRRGDSQQRENIRELKEQRDHWKGRAEECETELAEVKRDHQTRRHKLRGQVQRFWLLAVHWRQVALDHDAADTGEIPDVEDV